MWIGCCGLASNGCVLAGCFAFARLCWFSACYLN